MLLDEARAATAQALATGADVRDAYPRLRDSMRPLAALHRAHAEALDEAGRAGCRRRRPVPIVGGDADRARWPRSAARRPGSSAGSRPGRCRRAAARFARLLASMSAGVAAHLVDLPAGP